MPSNNAFLYTLATPQLSVSYVPDVFGLNKRTVEAAAAQEQATRYQMIAVDITLTANVAQPRSRTPRSKTRSRRPTS